MAKVRNNIVIQGLSGSLGDQLVIRKGRGGKTIVGVMPNFAENREFNETQKAHQEAFRQAVTYAKSVKNEAVYLAKAEKEDKSSFNVAVADWFHKPEVVEIDS